MMTYDTTRSITEGPLTVYAPDMGCDITMVAYSEVGAWFGLLGGYLFSAPMFTDGTFDPQDIGEVADFDDYCLKVMDELKAANL